MKEIKIPSGVFPMAGGFKMIGIVFIDLITATVTLSFIIEILKLFSLNIPQWIVTVFGVAYPLLAYRDVVKSVGRWSHGIKRYSYSEVEGYSGTGVLFVVEDYIQC